jgi:hypothetical protein
MYTILHRIEFINDFVTGFVSEMVYTGDVNEVIEPECIAGMQAYIAQGRSLYTQCALLAESGLVDDGSRKSAGQLFGHFV